MAYGNVESQAIDKPAGDSQADLTDWQVRDLRRNSQVGAIVLLQLLGQHQGVTLGDKKAAQQPCGHQCHQQQHADELGARVNAYGKQVSLPGIHRHKQDRITQHNQQAGNPDCHAGVKDNVLVDAYGLLHYFRWSIGHDAIGHQS